MKKSENNVSLEKSNSSMKNSNFNVMFLIGVICLVASLLFTFFAFRTIQKNDSNKTVNNNVSKVEIQDSVVAVLNDKNILRSEIGSDLLSSEQDIILTYIYDELKKEFFSDVEVKDSDVDLHYELLKQQVGEAQWPVYLASVGQRDEESFKVFLKESLKQEIYISNKEDEIEISDEEAQEIYNKNPNSYNIAVMDTLFFDNVETFKQAKDLRNNNMSLEDIAKNLNMEIVQDRCTYYEVNGLNWVNSFNSSKVGDYNMTTEDSGTLVIGIITELHEGLQDEEVKVDLVDSLKYEQAYDIANNEFIEFLKTQKCQIMGVDYPLYEEVDNTNVDNTDANVGE